MSATQRKAGGDSTAARNRKKLDANKGGAKLEDSQNGRPSRKSTRKSAGHDKRTSNLELRQKARIRHV